MLNIFINMSVYLMHIVLKFIAFLGMDFMLLMSSCAFYLFIILSLLLSRILTHVILVIIITTIVTIITIVESKVMFSLFFRILILHIKCDLHFLLCRFLCFYSRLYLIAF